MVLVCDVGNTNIVIGIYNDGWKHILRTETLKNESALHYSLILNECLWEHRINPTEIEYKSLSTVVPELKDTMWELLRNLNGSPVVIVDKNLYSMLPLKIMNSREIGTDIVCNALAAYLRFKKHLLVIDFGTALTFTVIDDQGEIIGVNIAPGIKIAIETLVARTSQLPIVDISFPINPIGTTTNEAIQNGVLVGYVGLIKYMIKVLKNHLDHNFVIVATGGLSSLLYPHIGEIDHVLPNLTLDGIRIAGKIYLDSNG
jgi:type III pantothenate kinase